VSRSKPITIIGGGLAGLTLGIALRRLKVPATIWEAGHYPRHRVCGEFISGRGQAALHELGLLEELMKAGATLSHTASFFLGRAKSPVRDVNPPALCLSRFRMDQVLAECFRREGGDLRENSRWQGEEAEGIVWASGRRIQPIENGWRWFGLKIHARRVELDADLEMHGSKDSYVGLCRLPEGEVNVCGLFRSRQGSHATAQVGKECLKGNPGTALHSRLKNAELIEESFCAVAGLPLRPQRAVEQEGCRLGDALTMIPPVTGNGMSMAFESAEIARDPLAAYARGEHSWESARQAIARNCDKAFRRRLAWAKWLQWMMFWPALQGGLGTWVLSSERLWQLLFTRTR
jgi:flavin-dependent dehydrogenase